MAPGSDVDVGSNSALYYSVSIQSCCLVAFYITIIVLHHNVTIGHSNGVCPSVPHTYLVDASETAKFC